MGIKEGEYFKWDVTITDDVDHSWCTGERHYWELTVDIYSTTKDYWILGEDYYQRSQKFQVHKYPDHFAREMLIGENYFTYMIIPVDTGDFLYFLEYNLKDNNFGFHEANIEKYGFSDYESYYEWLANKSAYYEINGMSIDIEIRNTFDNQTICFQSLTYNDEGLLEESVLRYEDQIIMKMTLEDYEIFDYKPYPNTEEIITFILLVISIVICGIILIIIIRSYHKTQSKDSINSQTKTTSVKTVPKPVRTSYVAKGPENRKSCSKCNTSLAENALFCHNCGQAKNSKERFCAYCGVKTLDGAIYCLKCGNKL